MCLSWLTDCPEDGELRKVQLLRLHVMPIIHDPRYQYLLCHLLMISVCFVLIDGRSAIFLHLHERRQLSWIAHKPAITVKNKVHQQFKNMAHLREPGHTESHAELLVGNKATQVFPAPLEDWVCILNVLAL